MLDSISKYFMFHEMTLKLYFMKCPERKISQGILPFRNFAKLTEKHLRQSLFFNKVAGLRPEILFKKRLWHRCFPVNFAKFLRTLFLQNTPRRLLLQIMVITYFWFHLFYHPEEMSLILTVLHKKGTEISLPFL